MQNNGQSSARQKTSADGGFADARLFFASSLDKNDRGDVFQIYQGGLYNHEHRTDSGPAFLGPGWNAYHRLAAPGDIDGDGRADLLATDARGDLYRYLSDGTGGFTPRVKIGNGWNTYTGLL